MKQPISSLQFLTGRRSAREDLALVVTALVTTVIMIAGFVYYDFFVRRMSGFNVYAYYGLILSLSYCSFSYQLNRFGAARRKIAEENAAAADTDYLFNADAPSVTILVPTYREERRVVIETILSAALAEYSNRKIVVLVDDPPSDRLSLGDTLDAIEDIRSWLVEPMARLREEQAQWLERSSREFDAESEGARLGENYAYILAWVARLAERMEGERSEAFRHVDDFVMERVVGELATKFEAAEAAARAGSVSRQEVDLAYRKLAHLCCDDITSFQRKTFENLSHAPNKAMNLNSYIGLMGGRYKFDLRDGLDHLIDAGDEDADLVVPMSDYVLTLDADSVILNDYIVTLVDILQRDPQAGVAQTPYLSFPDSRSPVERIAGATTDIQYLAHQGSSFFRAAYWVGANALIRYTALKEICKVSEDGGKQCMVFIQDATVIEDTGSTIDLLRKGWTVHNHFTPLAYSATPADFGALTVQRQRWANGGLIIFPMLLRQYFSTRGRIGRIAELALRSNYLLSPLIGNLAILTLMLWSGANASSMIWTPLIMLPYFILYSLDLKRMGYRCRDIFGVSSLNLMLLPVNFSGIASSVRQLITGRKGSFARTPKVANRTFIPPYSFLFNAGLLFLMVGYCAHGVYIGSYAESFIPAVNVIIYGYGLTRFIGVGAGFDDLQLVMGQALTNSGAKLASGATNTRELALALVPGPRIRRHVLSPILATVLVAFIPSSLFGDVANGEMTNRAETTASPFSGANGRLQFFAPTVPVAKPASGAGRDAALPGETSLRQAAGPSSQPRGLVD